MNRASQRMHNYVIFHQQLSTVSLEQALSAIIIYNHGYKVYIPPVENCSFHKCSSDFILVSINLTV